MLQLANYMYNFGEESSRVIYQKKRVGLNMKNKFHLIKK